MSVTLPTITDPDSDQYYIKLLNKPNFIDYSSGVLTYTPGRFDIGMHFFTINLKDNSKYGV